MVCKDFLLKGLLLKLSSDPVTFKQLVFQIVDEIVFEQLLRSLFKKRFGNRVLAKVVDRYAFVEKISEAGKFVEFISGIKETPKR